MYLVRQVLDKQIDDKDGSKAGKVDDLVLDLHDDGALEVVAILTGPNSAVSQLPGWIVGLTNWIRTTILGLTDRTKPEEIDWSHITRIDVTVHLDLDRREAGLIRSQQTIWERWLKPLPFSER
jgi:sporulation protein YlmC with PRC-barrel domain